MLDVLKSVMYFVDEVLRVCFVGRVRFAVNSSCCLESPTGLLEVGDFFFLMFVWGERIVRRRGGEARWWRRVDGLRWIVINALRIESFSRYALRYGFSL